MTIPPPLTKLTTWSLCPPFPLAPHREGHPEEHRHALAEENALRPDNV